MITVGRRIIFDRSSGEVILDMGEMSGDVLPREPLGELDYIDLKYNQYSDEFSRAVKYHVDSNTNKIVFDKLREPIQTDEKRIVELENQLLIAEGVI